MATHEHGHDHSHGAGHHHHHEPASYNMAFFIAVVANLLYTIAQVVFALLANSSSLLADAGHNLGDVLSLIFAWVADSLNKKGRSDRYTFGYKKTSILAALINAVVLMFTCGIILVDTVYQFMHPEPIVARDVIIVALIGVVVNGATALMFMRGAKEDLNIKGAFLHLALDAGLSLGVAISGTIVYFTHWWYADPLMALLIVIFIVRGSWSLLRESFILMINGVPSHIDLPILKAELLKLDGVEAVHDLHVWGLSTKETAMSVHLVMQKGKQWSAQLRHALDDRLHNTYRIGHSTIQIESLGEECESNCDDPNG